MRGIGEHVLNRVDPAEHGLILAVIVVAAVLSMAGTYWHMRAKMRPAGRNEPEAARPAPAAPRGHEGRAGAARGWAYETDAAGRPRRFLTHREAAWWAACRVGVVFVPLLVYTFARVLFGFDGPYPWSAILYVAAGVVLASLATVGAVYLYLALSGGVMGKAERRRRGDGTDAP
jgi:hypothetical protein